MSQTIKPRALTPREERDEQIAALRKLPAINALTEDVLLPNDLAAALTTGRIELLRLVKPRALSADEAAHLYKLIAVLIETNTALQAHAHEASRLANTWSRNVKGVVRQAFQLAQFTDFRLSDEDGDDEDGG